MAASDSNLEGDLDTLLASPDTPVSLPAGQSPQAQGSMITPGQCQGSERNAMTPSDKAYLRARSVLQRRLEMARSTLSDRDAVVDELVVVCEDLRKARLACDDLEVDLEMELDPTLSLNAVVVESRVARRIAAIRDETTKGARVKLTEIKTPQFDGNVVGYIRFKSQFRELIETRCTPAVAHMKLRDEALIKGTPAQLVVAGTESVTEACQELDSLFYDPEMIRNSLLSQLRNLVPIQRMSDSESLRQLVATLTAVMKDLDSIGESDALDSAAFSCLMTKIPPRMRDKVDESIYLARPKMHIRDKFDLLLSRCKFQAKLTDSHVQRTKAYGASGRTSYDSGTTSKVPPTVNVVSASSGRGPSTCLLHPEATRHRTSGCSRLSTLSTQDLLALVKKHDHCLRCLDKHAPGSSCDKQCPEPDCANPTTHSKHLHLLVGKSKKSATSAIGVVDETHAAIAEHSSETLVAVCEAVSVVDTTIDYDCESDDSTGSNSLAVSAIHSESSSGELDGDKGRHTLRPSHTAFIKASGGLLQINVFYDLGSDLSQITHTCAAATGLRPLGTVECLSLRVAGDSRAKPFGRSHLIDLPLCDEHGSVLFKVVCASVPYIGQLRGANIQTVREMFQDGNESISVSDIVDPPAGDIHVLIGCNHPEFHPVPLVTVGSVTVAQTPFAKVVYGSHPTFRSLPFSRAHVVSCQLQSCILAAHSVPPYHDISCSQQGIAGKELDIYDRLSRIDDLPCDSCGHYPGSGDKTELHRRDVYRECLEFQPDKGRVVASLPWIIDLQSLEVDNRPMALKRLQALTKTLAKNPVLRDAYKAEFRKMKDRGLLVPVTPEEKQAWEDDDGKSWYVPHFPVVNEKSQSTPVRVVFDPSVPYQGIHLSKMWESPPNLVPNILGMFIRFRDHPVALSLDFAKAYWTVHLRDTESHMQRVLWNDMSLDNPVQTLRMTRNSFGMVPSGAICSLAMNMVAEHHAMDFPQVFDFVSNQVYVDDGVSSCETVSGAIDLANTIQHVMSTGGFELKHFVIGGSVEKPLSLPNFIQWAGGETRTVLGAEWNPDDDTLSVKGGVQIPAKRKGSKIKFSVSEDTFEQDFPAELTLRQYLSVLASLFDPLGLTSPVSILLRHELGRIFLLGIGWDEPIPRQSKNSDQASYEKCKSLVKLFYALRRVKFPRCVKPPNSVPGSAPVLVGFSDSSQTAYACAVYYNWETKDGPRESVLVVAKSKPFPKKGSVLTIPRGELLGCLLLAKVASAVQRYSVHSPIKCIFLSDSTIALTQIATQPVKLKIWPAVRVEQIQTLTNKQNWFHIRSEENVADCATRGLDPTQIEQGSTWQVGPAFLAKPLPEWPIRPVSDVTSPGQPISESELEVRPAPKMGLTKSCSGSPVSELNTTAALVVDSVESGTLADPTFFLSVLECTARLPLPVPKPHQNWKRLRKIVARVVEFIRRLRYRTFTAQQLPGNFSNLSKAEQRQWIDSHDKFVPTPHHMRIAELALIRQAQSRVINPHTLSSWRKLNPVQDQFGIWRAKGRVHDVNTAPMIVPGQTNLALVLLEWFHEKSHSSSDTTLAMAREFYWIVRGQVLANRIVGQCVRCRRLRKNPVEIDMAPLDHFRTQRFPVFSTVYLDLCGPYMCKSDRRDTRANPALSGKVWIMVIICASSHAVHLELVQGYSTAAFLAALDAYFSLRSRPTRIIADRGSQIKSAGGSLQSLWEHLDCNVIKNHMCESTEWVFVPAGAHPFVGMAERLVCAVKAGIEVTTCAQKPVLEKLQFSRLLYSVANVINDRPLTVGRNRVSKLDDIRIIRPNDLLLGRTSEQIKDLIELDFDDLQGKRRQFFELLKLKKVFLNQFWDKFYRVVFHTLLPKSKWLKTGRQVAVGDIVLIRDTNPVRGVWTLGQIERTIVSNKDGKIRTAMVRYKEALGRKTKSKQALSVSKLLLKSVRDLVVLCPSEEMGQDE